MLPSSPSSWKNPYYLYLILDFVRDVRLGDLDANLSASIILGLRIAYDYFAHKVTFRRVIFLKSSK